MQELGRHIPGQEAVLQDAYAEAAEIASTAIKAVKARFGRERHETLEPIEREVVRILPFRIMETEASLALFRPTVSSVQRALRADGSTNELFPNLPGFQPRRGPLKERIQRRIARGLANDLLQPGKLNLTATMWELKGADATNPHQLILPGGPREEIVINTGRMGPQNTGPDNFETRLEGERVTLRRKLATETNIFGVEDRDIHALNLSRTTRFTHRKRTTQQGTRKHFINKEEYYFAEVPPFLSGGMYDPEDKAARLLYLPPTEVEELFTRERLSSTYGNGHRPQLLDAWRKQHTGDAQYVNGATAEQVEKVITTQAYRFEIEIKKKLVDQLLVINPSLAQASIKVPNDAHTVSMPVHSYWETFRNTYATINSVEQAVDFEAQYAQLLRLLQQEYRSDTAERTSEYEERYRDIFTSLDTVGLTQQHAPILRAHIIHMYRFHEDLTRAHQRIVFEHSLPYIRNTGTQEPFLLAQLMLKMGNINSYELDSIRELTTHTPTHTIGEAQAFSTEATDIFPQNEAVWGIMQTACDTFGIEIGQENWYERLQTEMRTYRDLRIRVRRGQSLDPQDRIRRDEVERNFELFFSRNFGIPLDRIKRLETDIHDFGTYVLDSLKKATDKDLRAELIARYREPALGGLYSSMLGAFGFNLSGTEEMSEEDRLSNWRHLLLMVTKYHSDIEQEQAISEGVETLNDALNSMLGPIKDIQDTGAIIMQRRELMVPLPPRIEIPGLPGSVDVSTFTNDILYGWRPKQDLSRLRKKIERGDNNPNDDEEVTDDFGNMIAIDSDLFRDQLRRRYPFLLPSQVESITSTWVRHVTEAIVHHFHQTLTDYKWNYSTSKVREGGPMTGVLEKLARETGLKTTPPDAHGGSGAYHPRKWLKFVHSIERDEGDTEVEEYQIFASIHDAQLKIEDDETFDFIRWFLSHGKRRFPPVTVLHGIGDTHPQLWKGRFAHVWNRAA